MSIFHWGSRLYSVAISADGRQNLSRRWIREQSQAHRFYLIVDNNTEFLPIKCSMVVGTNNYWMRNKKGLQYLFEFRDFSRVRSSDNNDFISSAYLNNLYKILKYL